MKKLILASASPRRRELLEQVGIPFEVRVSHAQEITAATLPGQIVEELSRCKAQAVAGSLQEADGRWALAGKKKEAGETPGAKKRQPLAEAVILGADTIVVLDGQILGKPRDEQEARRMLRALQGRTHLVYTGVTLIHQNETSSFHEKTQVTVYPMTEEEIDRYVKSGDCMDKAGAYGIQGAFAVYIQGICGDYYNVVGLPVGRLWQELKKFA